jgi:hypothetical protein
MKQLTGTRERGNAGTRNNRGERGSALVTVLILIIVLTMIGAAMVTVTLTEITLGFNQADAAISRGLADAGMNRAASELATNLTWAGTGGPIPEGDGTYDVVVTASGSTRYITSTGVRGGGRQILRGSFKAVPRVAVNTVLANTTATIGAATTGLTVSNTMPSPDATAVHANRILGGATAMTINTTGATVIGGLTSNGGSISGVSCATWPWRCNTAFGTIPVKQINADSLRTRAIAAGRYFQGGHPSSICTQTYSYGLGQTQRCLDRYIHDQGGVIGSTGDPIFFIEPFYFGSGEPTSYTRPTLTPARRGVASNSTGGATSLTITRPAGVVANDVMVAAMNVRGGSGVTITEPAGWTLVSLLTNGAAIRMGVYYKVATSSEPASYTWNFSSSRKAAGGIQAYSNVDPVAPIEAENGQATASGISHSTPDITTYSTNTMLVASFGIAFGTSWTPAVPGMAEWYEARATGGGGGTQVTASGNDQLDAAPGLTGAKTATSGNAAVGVTHLLALRGGGSRVDCTGYASAVNTLCVRSTPTGEFANSRPNQVTGTVVAFGRGTGTSTQGDIVIENLSLRTANYTHTSLAGDPAFVAGGRFEVISSGALAASRTVDIIGIVYTFAGTDNPDVNSNMLGSAGTGMNVQHGASLVVLTFHGVLISNGSITLQDTVTNSGVVSVLYDAAVADQLPLVFTTSSIDNVIFPMSWSAGD